MTTTLKYNPSRGGHAPGHLRDALLRALSEGRGNEKEPWWNHLEVKFLISRQQIWWGDWSPLERALWLTGQLWNCRDILPGSACVQAGLPRGSSYSRLARQLRNEVIQELVRQDPSVKPSELARLLRDDYR